MKNQIDTNSTPKSQNPIQNQTIRENFPQFTTKIISYNSLGKIRLHDSIQDFISNHDGWFLDDSIVCKYSSKILKAHILTQPGRTVKLKEKKEEVGRGVKIINY